MNAKVKLWLLTVSMSVLLYRPASAQESQDNILVNFQSGNYDVYKVADNKKFTKVSKPWPVQITKAGATTSQVLIKRSGILDEPFTPDVAGYPAYFAYKTYRLSFIEGSAFYYEWNGKQQATTKYVLVPSGNSFDLDISDANQLIQDYAVATFKQQTEARSNLKAEKTAKKAAEKLANSLQNKQVLKLDLILLEEPQHVAHFSDAIRYGITATLKNGTVLKTPNLGGKIPWDDFELNHVGCSNTIAEVRVDEDASTLTNDYIQLSITSKHHPTLTTSRKVNTTNDVSIQVNANGFWGVERHKHMTVFQGVDGQHAGNGDNLTVKIERVNHRETGQPLNKIEIYNNTKGKTIAKYKLKPSTKLIINTRGGQGMNGSVGRSGENKGGDGGNGGNGGNVMIIKNPNVSVYNIIINNQGGSGGNGGAPYYSSGVRGNRGQDGMDGSQTTQVQSLNLNF